MIPWYLLVASTFFIHCPFVRGFRQAVTFGHARVFVSASNKDFEKNGFQGKIEEYNYSDEDGSYDVPFVREQKWYRLNVKKASEKKLYEYFQQHSKATDSIWKDVVMDAYYPSKSYLTFKGKNLQIKSKAMIPGLLYLKTSRMDIGNMPYSSFDLILSRKESPHEMTSCRQPPLISTIILFLLTS